MARIRTIKPEFFTSEDIVSLSPLARLLYVALWCEADRDGRMAWKPRTFKMRYLPADYCDVGALCDELIDSGLVKLYGDGLAYIPCFGRHQHLNPREAVSTLPDPHASATREPRVSHATVTVETRDSDAQGGREGKGREGKGREREELSGAKAPSSAEPTKRPTIPCPYEAIVEAYHHALPSLPSVRLMNPARQKALRKVWAWVLTSTKPDGSRRALNADEALQWFRAYFERASLNDFLMGRSGRTAEHANWKPDLEFLLTDRGMAHVIERTQDAA